MGWEIFGHVKPLLTITVVTEGKYKRIALLEQLCVI
jgi:hypothetical protein